MFKLTYSKSTPREPTERELELIPTNIEIVEYKNTTIQVWRCKVPDPCFLGFTNCWSYTAKFGFESISCFDKLTAIDLAQREIDKLTLTLPKVNL